MLLTDRSSAPSDLYVPGASIALGEESLDLYKAYGLNFTQVEVDLQLSVGGQFRFTVPRAFDIEKRDFFTPHGQPLMALFKLGTRVWIRMGYGEPNRQSLLFSGFIIQVSTSFAEGGAPELEVSGQDLTYLMTLGTNEHRITEKQTMRDAVDEVAKKNGITLKFSGNPPSNVALDANKQTDLDFLRKLVENFSKANEKWEFFVRAKSRQDELHFRPRSPVNPPLVKLSWGEDLLSFKPEIDLGKQVQKVRVLGWDEVRKEEIVGEAIVENGAKGEKGGGNIQQSAFGREAVLELKLPVKSKEEAKQRAEAALADRKNDLLKGEGETFGLPELLPDTSIELIGIGQQFSALYYVTKTVHRYDTSGYRTRFSVERSVA